MDWEYIGWCIVIFIVGLIIGSVWGIALYEMFFVDKDDYR